MADCYANENFPLENILANDASMFSQQLSKRLG